MKNQKFDPSSKRLAIAVALLTVAALGSGCGQQAYNEGTTATGGGSTTTTAGNTGGTTDNPSPVTGGTTSDSNGSANYNFYFWEKGNNTSQGLQAVQQSPNKGQPMNVTTDATLKITITAGEGGIKATGLNGSNWYTGFNCMKFNITVGNSTVPVFVARAGYQDINSQYYPYFPDPCRGAPTTWSHDFSNSLGVSHGNITIKVAGMQTDNCHLAPLGPNYGGCAIGPLFTDYEADAYINVFTD